MGISAQSYKLLAEIREAVIAGGGGGGGGGGTVELGQDTIDALAAVIDDANDGIEASLTNIANTLNDVLAELLQKLEAGEDVGLTEDAVDALAAAIAALYAFPSDYPDTGAHTRLDSIDGHVDGLESLLGTASTTPPSSGTGAIGWLRGIYDRLGSTLTVNVGLTDTQLRATPVPVSGTVTVTDGSGPITVDGTVAVSGSVAVTGPLTDTQLRASAVQVTDRGATSTVTTVTGSLTSGTIIASNAARKQVIIENDSAAVLYLRFGTAAASATDRTFALVAGAIHIEDHHTGAMTGVWSAAVGTARITETA